MTVVQQAETPPRHPHTGDNLSLGTLGRRLTMAGGATGVVALAAAIVLARTEPEGTRRLAAAYLTNLTFFLSLSLGGLFFVLLQHLTRSGWSVSVRRVAEMVAAAIITPALLCLPVLVLVGLRSTVLYPWVAAPVAEPVRANAAYLSVPFFLARAALVLGLFVLIARVFFLRSLAQDATYEPGTTRRLEKWSAGAMLIYAFATTVFAIDFLMSLEPSWSSTIFGVYFFAGSVVGFLAGFILVLMLLQRSGRLRASITTEHYHDLGKLLFAFVFFWAYIAFSQFMLIWYANLPEETSWFAHRMSGGWGKVGVTLIVAAFGIPFLALLLRASKRRGSVLAALAGLVLAAHWLDLYWVVAPSSAAVRVAPDLLFLLCGLGIGGLYVATLAAVARGRSLLALGDPRLGEALTFENI